MQFRWLFDYVYYRITHLYLRWYGKEGPMGAVIVTFVQTCIIACLVLFTARYFFSYSNTSEYSKIFGYGAMAFFVIMYTINFVRYQDRFESLDERWKGETEQQKTLRGLIMVISILIPFILLIIINSFTRHLHFGND